MPTGSVVRVETCSDHIGDVMALEQSGVYRGLYHVLLGRIAPLEGIGPEQLTIEQLVDRVRAGEVRGMYLNPNCAT